MPTSTVCFCFLPQFSVARNSKDHNQFSSLGENNSLPLSKTEIVNCATYICSDWPVVTNEEAENCCFQICCCDRIHVFEERLFETERMYPRLYGLHRSLPAFYSYCGCDFFLFTNLFTLFETFCCSKKRQECSVQCSFGWTLCVES